MKQRNAVIDCYNKSAEQYADALFHELEGKSLDRLLLQRFASMVKGGSIVELGCGCGQIGRFLWDQGMSDLVGLDISTNMINEARKRNSDTKIKFEEGDMLALPYDASSFVGVVAFYAIVHFTIAELETVFSEVQRVLRPGGHFLFSFHVGEGSIHTTELFEVPVDVHFHFFGVDQIIELVHQAGLTITEVVERYPYEGKEHPSRRAYISCVS